MKEEYSENINEDDLQNEVLVSFIKGYYSSELSEYPEPVDADELIDQGEDILVNLIVNKVVTAESLAHQCIMYCHHEMGTISEPDEKGTRVIKSENMIRNWGDEAKEWAEVALNLCANFVIYCANIANGTVDEEETDFEVELNKYAQEFSKCDMIKIYDENKQL